MFPSILEETLKPFYFICKMWFLKCFRSFIGTGKHVKWNGSVKWEKKGRGNSNRKSIRKVPARRIQNRHSGSVVTCGRRREPWIKQPRATGGKANSTTAIERAESWPVFSCLCSLTLGRRSVPPSRYFPSGRSRRKAQENWVVFSSHLVGERHWWEEIGFLCDYASPTCWRRIFSAQPAGMIRFLPRVA